MSLVFWGLTTTMMAVAVATVVTPIKVGRSAGNGTAAILAIAVALIAIGFYSGLGSPEAVTAENDHPQQNRTGSPSASSRKSDTSVASVASLLDGLRDRLERQPDDADGWLLLARSYEHLGRHQEAATAYSRATKLGKTDAQLERIIVSAGLSRDEPAADQGTAIRGRITLSPEAAAVVQPGDTVFLFVKADLNQPMPLLALRKTIADLPFEYTLTDDMAMLPGTRLEDFDKVVVVARVSRSGRAKDVLDGLETSSDLISPLAKTYVDLQIAPGSVLKSNIGNVPE